MSFLWQPLHFEKLKTIEKDGRRHYITPGGNVYPSVTTKLSEKPKPELEEWEKRVGKEEAEYRTNSSASRGEALHKVAEKYIKGENYKKGAMPNTLVLFNSLKSHLDNNLDLIYCTETSLYSDYLKLAGTTDLFAVWNGIVSVIDYKTSRKVKKKEWIEDYFLQSTIYAMMIEELKPGIKVPQIVVAIAVEFEQPQIFVEDKEKFKPSVLKLIQ